MGSKTLGEGTLILTANADQMLAGLDKASKAADKASKNIGDKLNPKSGGGAFAGGFAGAMLGKAFEEPIKKVTEAVAQWVTGSNRFRTYLTEAADAADLAARSMDRGMRLADERLGAIADPKERLAEINRQTDALKGQLAEQMRIRDAAREWEGKLKDSTSFESWEMWAGGALESGLSLVEMKGAKAADAIAKITDKMADLNEVAKRIKTPALDLALVGDVNKLTESLKTQAATIGMTSSEAQVYGLKMRGATDGMLAGVERLNAKLKEATLSAEVDEVIKGLRLQRETLGMNASEAQIYGLKLKGANESMLDGIRREQMLLDAAKPTEVKLGGAFDKGSTGAYSIVAKNNTANQLAASDQKKLIEQQKKAADGIWKMVDLIKNATPLGVLE